MVKSPRPGAPAPRPLPALPKPPGARRCLSPAPRDGGGRRTCAGAGPPPRSPPLYPPPPRSTMDSALRRRAGRGGAGGGAGPARAAVEAARGSRRRSPAGARVGAGAAAAALGMGPTGLRRARGEEARGGEGRREAAAGSVGRFPPPALPRGSLGRGRVREGARGAEGRPPRFAVCPRPSYGAGGHTHTHGRVGVWGCREPLPVQPAAPEREILVINPRGLGRERVKARAAGWGWLQVYLKKKKKPNRTALKFADFCPTWRKLGTVGSPLAGGCRGSLPSGLTRRASIGLAAGGAPESAALAAEPSRGL